MGPITNLLSVAHSLGGRTEAWNTAKRRQPTFPSNGCANFLSALLDLSGLGVGVHMLAQDLANVLEQDAGWERVDVADYQPGDIGVTDAVIDPPNADHIYLVLARVDDNNMTVVDNQAGSPEGNIHARTIEPTARFTHTAYFLRFADPVAVSFNGNMIGDAEGYIHQGRSFGWVRPIATALGLGFNFTDSAVTLTVADQEAQIPATLFGDQAFVALADFERLAGVNVGFDDVNSIVTITQG